MRNAQQQIEFDQQLELDRIRLQQMATGLRQMRLLYSAKLSNRDPLYHTFSHAVHDVDKARSLLGDS